MLDSHCNGALTDSRSHPASSKKVYPGKPGGFGQIPTSSSMTGSLPDSNVTMLGLGGIWLDRGRGVHSLPVSIIYPVSLFICLFLSFAPSSPPSLSSLSCTYTVLGGDW